MPISDDQLRELAGALIFERGARYALEGRVNVSEASTDSTVARVQGTRSYTTRLWLDHGELGGECSCPHADEGAFCKHMVAVALAWRQQSGAAAPVAKAATEPSARERAARQRHDELRSFLVGQPAQLLAEKLLWWADRSRELRSDLHFWRQQADATVDPRALKSAVSEQLQTSGFLDWRQSNDFALRAARAVELLQAALAAGRYAACVQVAETAIGRLFKICGHADDSDGAIGSELQRVIEVWVAALRHAPGDRKALAARVYQLRRLDPFGMIELDVLGDILGAEGLDRYDACAAKAWHALPARIPPAGKSFVDRHWVDDERYDEREIDDLYEEVLRRHGDIDAVLAVLTRDLSRAHRVHEIVEYCQSVNRLRQAVMWAEKGVKLFADDWTLKRLLAELYERDGLDEPAAGLRFTLFCLHPSAASYADYVNAAARAKSIGREAARERALQWAEQHEKPATGASSDFRRRVPDVSLRVELALAEQRLDDALTLAQTGHACNAALIETLAGRLPPAQAADAVALFKRLVDHHVQAVRDSSYTDALRLARAALTRMNNDAGAAWLVELRARFRAKRNFIKGLDAIDAIQS